MELKMEEEIEDKIQEILGINIDVKYVGIGIYDVFFKKAGELDSIRYFYDKNITMERNIGQIIYKITNELEK